MPKLFVPAGLLALVGLALAQTTTIVPLKVKTGLWENHATVTASGSIGLPPEMAQKLTPEQRAHIEAQMAAAAAPHTSETTEKGCVTQQDLSQNPASLLGSNPNMTCKADVVSSSASDLELHTTCTGQAQMEMHIKLHAQDAEHISGRGDGNLTMGGHTMKSTYSFDSHWLGANCPANK